MPIRIKTEKLIFKNEKYRRILNFDLLNKNNLPNEYMKNGTGPCCFEVIREYNNEPCTRWMMIWAIVLDGKGRRWNVGDKILESEFQEGLELIKAAGKRLGEIKKKLEFSGIEEFTI